MTRPGGILGADDGSVDASTDARRSLRRAPAASRSGGARMALRGVVRVHPFGVVRRRSRSPYTWDAGRLPGRQSLGSEAYPWIS